MGPSITFVMLCDTNNWTCGQWKFGRSIMTMRESVFHAKHNILPVHKATYSSDMDPCLKCHLKVANFSNERALYRMYGPAVSRETL